MKNQDLGHCLSWCYSCAVELGSNHDKIIQYTCRSVWGQSLLTWIRKTIVYIKQHLCVVPRRIRMCWHVNYVILFIWIKLKCSSPCCATPISCYICVMWTFFSLWHIIMKQVYLRDVPIWWVGESTILPTTHRGPEISRRRSLWKCSLSSKGFFLNIIFLFEHQYHFQSNNFPN